VSLGRSVRKSRRIRYDALYRTEQILFVAPFTIQREPKPAPRRANGAYTAVPESETFGYLLLGPSCRGFSGFSTLRLDEANLAQGRRSLIELIFDASRSIRAWGNRYNTDRSVVSGTVRLPYSECLSSRGPHCGSNSSCSERRERQSNKQVQSWGTSDLVTDVVRVGSLAKRLFCNVLNRYNPW
jgi:hypothetical protein